jgi:hypothetical protein
MRAVNLHHGAIEARNEDTGLLVSIKLPLDFSSDKKPEADPTEAHRR